MKPFDHLAVNVKLDLFLIVVIFNFEFPENEREPIWGSTS